MIINFTRPYEIPYTQQLKLWDETERDWLVTKEDFHTLIDTGAAYNIIDTGVWERIQTPVIPGYQKILEGIAGSFFANVTAIRTNINGTDYGYICYYIADLAAKSYKSILGMSFLRNFDFIFKLNSIGDYYGKFELTPLYRQEDLVFNAENMVPNADVFGVYTTQQESP